MAHAYTFKKRLICGTIQVQRERFDRSSEPVVVSIAPRGQPFALQRIGQAPGVLLFAPPGQLEVA